MLGHQDPRGLTSPSPRAPPPDTKAVDAGGRRKEGPPRCGGGAGREQAGAPHSVDGAGPQPSVSGSAGRGAQATEEAQGSGALPAYPSGASRTTAARQRVCTVSYRTPGLLQPRLSGVASPGTGREAAPSGRRRPGGQGWGQGPAGDSVTVTGERACWLPAWPCLPHPLLTGLGPSRGCACHRRR